MKPRKRRSRMIHRQFRNNTKLGDPVPVEGFSVVGGVLRRVSPPPDRCGRAGHRSLPPDAASLTPRAPEGLHHMGSSPWWMTPWIEGAGARTEEITSECTVTLPLKVDDRTKSVRSPAFQGGSRRAPSFHPATAPYYLVLVPSCVCGSLEDLHPVSYVADIFL